jgi:hypothetical protein
MRCIGFPVRTVLTKPRSTRLSVLPAKISIIEGAEAFGTKATNLGTRTGLINGG